MSADRCLSRMRVITVTKLAILSHFPYCSDIERARPPMDARVHSFCGIFSE